MKIFKRICLISLAIVLIIIFVFCVATPLSCAIMQIVYDIEVVAPNTFFAVNPQSICRGAHISDNKLYYECKLTLRNNSNCNKKFKLYMYNLVDVVSGVLQNPVTYAIDENGNELYFSLLPYESAVYSNVVFVGNAGRPSKAGRLMPMLFLQMQDEDIITGVEAQKRTEMIEYILPSPTHTPHT